MRRVLALRGYRRLLVAYGLNELAVAIGALALAVLVYRHTGSAIGAAAFFLSAQFVPALISPALVARIDGLAAARVLPALYGLEALTFLALAALASRFALVPLLLLTMLDGVLALSARAIARAASVAVTAPANLLREGNALSNTVFSICFMIGPALGGLIASQAGTVAALLTGAGLFLAIAMILLPARGLPGAAEERTRAPGRLRQALAHAARRPAIRTLLELQGVGLLFFTISIPVEVVFALHVLHAGQGGYGALLASWGAGTIAGSAMYAHWRARPARTLIALGAAALGGGFLVMALAPSLLVAIIGAVVAGCGNGIEAVSARTALQERVEAEWMAMMMSLNESLWRAIPGLGIILGGGLAALASPRVALGVAGVGAFAMAGLAWSRLRPEAAHTERAHPPPAGVEPARTPVESARATTEPRTPRSSPSLTR
ncbi:MAG: MFS transporter [Solirubrobacterales bacterium]|nr:MFS transporter [Solirubrobacterales bacterium]